MDLTSLHHVTAVSGKIRNNHHFYTGTLGMRLVKRSFACINIASATPFCAPTRTDARSARFVRQLSFRRPTSSMTAIPAELRP